MHEQLGRSAGSSFWKTDLPQTGAAGRGLGKTELCEICSQNRISKLAHLVGIKGRGSVQGMLHEVQASRRGRGLPPGRGILYSRARHLEASAAASKLGRLQQGSQICKHAALTNRKRPLEGAYVWTGCQVRPCRRDNWPTMKHTQTHNGPSGGMQ